MITIEDKHNYLLANIFNDFTVNDFKELEDHILYCAKNPAYPNQLVNLVINLTNMIDYTVDMLLEEYKFNQDHKDDVLYGRIAIVSQDTLLQLASAIDGLFTQYALQEDVKTRVLDSLETAIEWVNQAE